MNFLQFTIGMILIVSAAYLSINVNWSKELLDLTNLFRKAANKRSS
jgi:hypothetical protein